MLSDTGWWRRNGWTVAILLAAFSLAFLIRSLWAANLLSQWGWLYVYGGGSDSFYHSWVMQQIILTHSNLVVDPMLRYPTGAINPREPLFDWMNAILGIVFAPFFGGDAVRAGAFFLDIQAPLWAALGVFPVWLIGREVSSNRMGLLAALLFPLVVGSIDSSVLGYANYLTFYAFVILLTVYSYIRTVKSVASRRYVASFWRPREIAAAIRTFVRTERGAVKWSVFTGVCLGTLALAWQGYPFFITILVFFLFVQLIVERIRRIDSFGLYILTWIVGLVGFPLAMPYYIAQGLFQGWFDLPLLIFFGALLIALPFIWLRDEPWVVSIPILAGVAALAVASLYFVNRASFTNIVTGQGYFVKTLVYSTVAEAQAPSVDALILGYGVVTFFLAFVGLALFIYRTARGRFRREQTLFVVFAIVSIYLPITAAKFFLLGSAAFALLPAEAMLIALDAAGYPQLRRTVVALTDRRSQLGAFRRAFKARHALVMLLLIVIVLPNVWYAVDAGIPYNVKPQYNQQIYNTLPGPLRTSAANASGYYLGAAGVELDTPNQYDESGYNWLAAQDTNLPPAQRPAFISWWDYGFQAVSEGQHPTVADNFQNGIPAAGNFLLAQNESLAIGILATTLLAAESKTSGYTYLPPALNRELALDGVNLPELHTLLVNTSADIPLVIAHPERYLPVDPSHLDGQNAMYDTVSYFLATTLNENGVVRVYDDIQAYTGWSIRYAMVDSRLFPFTGSNTGIFYAPADLTDRVLGAGGAPTTYYDVTVLGSDGNTYPLGSVPAGVTPVNYNIIRHAPFYNSMIYRIYMGYNGTQIGQSAGIPGLEGAIASGYSPEPGWMLQHFQVVYRTGYYCPYPNPAAHPQCPIAANLPSAVALARASNTTADTSAASYFGGGESILEYYPGLTMAGALTTPDGAPIPGARLTVYDAWHIPHMTVTTDASGDYSLILPPGNDTVNVTGGSVSGLTQAGTTTLASLAMNVSGSLALNPGTPTLLRSIVLKPSGVQGFLYWNNANNTTFQPARDPLVSGATVELWGNGLRRVSTVTDPSGSFLFSSLAPGVYNVSALVGGANYTLPAAYATPGTVYNESSTFHGLTPTTVQGSAHRTNGAPVAGASVTLSQSSNGSVVARTTTDGSGVYRFVNVTTGNYSVSATLANQSLGTSPPATVNISTAGQQVAANLTLQRVVAVTLPLTDGGGIATPGVAVRFAPIPPSLPAVSPTGTTPPGDPPSDLPNGTVVVSGADGVVRTVLAAGNYSVYALGWDGSGYAAGLTSAFVPGPAPAVTLPTLALTPAYPLSGTVSEPAGTNETPGNALVTVFSATGDQVSAAVSSSGDWGVQLPAGGYTVLAAESGSSARASPLAAVASTVPVPNPDSVALPLAPGIRWNASIGQADSRAPHGVFPASGARVVLTLGGTGGTLVTMANASGNLSMVLPSSTPGGSICASVSAPGFTSYGACGFAPGDLARNVSRIPLSVLPVPTSVTLTGAPAGQTVDVNFTALGAPAVTMNATHNTSAGSSFVVSLIPGPYRVSAWARAPSGVAGQYAAAPVNSSVAIADPAANFTVPLARQVPYVGDLGLPPSLNASNVSVQLHSPTQNLTVSGTNFTSHFLATPGTYTAVATGRSSVGAFANVSQIVLASNGAVSAPVILGGGATLTANLTLPGNSTLAQNLSVSLIGPDGSVVPASAVSGVVTAILPSGVPFAVVMNTTLTQPGPYGVSQLETIRNATGASCTVGTNATTCAVPLVVTVAPAHVTGTVSAGYAAGVVQGTVTLVGPMPYQNATQVPIDNGAFTADVVPGRYTVYASGTPAYGPTGANATVVTIPYGPSVGVPVSLAPAVYDSLTIRSMATGASSSANVSWSNGLGALAVFPDQPVGPATSYALPAGVWQVHVNSTAAPYGVTARTTGNATAALLSGSAATQVTLVPVFSPRVAISVSPSFALVPEGGSTTFAFSVRNVGDSPVTVRFQGSPAYWGFRFFPESVRLGTLYSNDTASGQVVVYVPFGTPLAHPPMLLNAYQMGGNGSLVGTTAVGPAIDLPPAVGVSLGQTPSLSVIGPTSATLPFWIRNSGNVPESVSISIVDGSRLAGIGWNATLVSGRTPMNGSVALGAGANNTYTLRLASPTASPVSPGTVTLEAVATNGSMVGRTTLVVPVPPLAIGVTNGTLTVTGPNVGAPPAYPDWLIPALVFVPAVAFLASVFGLRWWRTRRWVRR
jgi:asparagine N-glycosylation enzyme membrane subunit Stt3